MDGVWRWWQAFSENSNMFKGSNLSVCNSVNHNYPVGQDISDHMFDTNAAAMSDVATNASDIHKRNLDDNDDDKQNAMVNNDHVDKENNEHHQYSLLEGTTIDYKFLH
jgi:hypothetical protein